MILILFFKAIVLGILVTAPVGPVGALVIRRTLKSGFLLGLFTGLGAALADAMYASVAALGVESVESFILKYEIVIALTGGILLVVMGAISLVKNFEERRMKSSAELELLPQAMALAEQKFQQASESRALHFFRAAVVSWGITISNPVTLVGFAGAFAAFGFATRHVNSDVSHYRTIIAGVFLGAMLWWTGLSLFIRWMRNRLSNSMIFMIHLSTSGIILGSGILCLLRGLMKFLGPNYF